MRALLITSLLFVGCATTQASESKAPPKEAPPPVAPPKAEKTAEERKAELLALFAREIPARPQQTFALAEKSVTVESATPVTPRASEGGKSVQLELGLGTSQPVTCFLYERGIDVGALATRLAGSVTGDTTVNSVRVADITVVEKAPAVFVELTYLAGKADARQLGALKLMFYSSDESPLMCMHDEPGYAESFKRITTTFAGAMAKALFQPEGAPTYRTVSVMRIKGTAIGFERTAWVKQPNGDRVMVTTSSAIIPRSATEFMSTDGATITTVGKDGRVIDKTDVHLSSGELERKVKLTRTKKGYHYEGTQQGKELAGDLTPADAKGLLSDVLIAKQTKALTAAKPTFTYEEYAPSTNPAALTKLTVTRDASAPNSFIIENGPMKLTAVLDADGMPQRVSVPVGPLLMEQERVFVEGKPE